MDIAMDDVKLAALMCSKVCHDLISPVGALGNGLEVLEEDDDAEMRQHAMSLIETSAQQASAKLKFARLAYGASGSAGAQIDLRDAEQVVRELLGGGKIEIEWQAPVATLDKDVVKLLTNLTHIACDCIPRGGTLSVVVRAEDGAGDFTIKAEGKKAKLAEETRVALECRGSVDDLDGRTVIPFVCGILAKSKGASVKIETGDDMVEMSYRFKA